MTRARLIGPALAMLIAAPAAAANGAVQACFAKMTGGEQKSCMEALQRAARAELDGVYRAVLESARKRESATFSEAAAIEASQKAWEAYRDAECRGRIGGGSWGSGTAAMVMGCYAEKNYERIQELKAPFDQR